MKTITYNPETHALVPLEPTEKMFAAANKIDDKMARGGSQYGADIDQVYYAMIDAAPQPEPNPNWCAGCSPDNCSGCGAAPVAYTTPQPDRTAELEQLRQRVAELEKERDELKLVVSAHADFFSRTQSEMADLKESVECLSATNDFLAGKRDENIILKAAVKQLTAERDAALNEARDFESDVDTVTQHNVELQLETIALKSALKVARDGIDEFLVANDPTEFGCACDLSVGYLCGPCHADKQRQPLNSALAKINEVLKP